MSNEAEAIPIGDWIRTTRNRKSQSQREAAAAIGVHLVTVCRWEKGHKTPGIGSMRALATWGGVELSELLAAVCWE